MDDTFCFLGKSSLEAVQKHLKSVTSDPVHSEAGNRWPTPISDVLVMRDEDKLKTTVYRKKSTPTDLPFHSHHGMQAGQSQVSDCENSDEESTSDQHLLKDELHHVQGVLRSMDIPKDLSRNTTSNVSKEKEKKG